MRALGRYLVQHGSKTFICERLTRMVRLPISVLSTEFVATNIFARVQRAEFVCLIQSANVLRTKWVAAVFVYKPFATVTSQTANSDLLND